MSATPHVPTLDCALGIFEKICAVEKSAAAEIARHMLRAANANRVNDDRNRDEPHVERMAGFMAGVENIGVLRGVFTSSAVLGKKMRTSDIDDLVCGINRYLSRNPDMFAKMTLNANERGMLESSPARFRQEHTCNLS